MIDELVQSVWPPMIALAYMLVTCCLVVLSSHHKKVIDCHDRARASRELRRRYLETLRGKVVDAAAAAAAASDGKNDDRDDDASRPARDRPIPAARQ
jgi:hypothetical protein